jgi:nitroimidazol reductase NimA-like FMN-containing flavoprotein (pyridoxamine 5'-phosphate oxidase superfamily)
MLGTLTEEQIDALLRQQTVGRIGCHADGQTYVVPITYAYDGENIYARSKDGLKLALMRANPEVCFEVDRVDDLANWQSVIAHGTFEELHGPAAEAATLRLTSRLLSRVASETSDVTYTTAAVPQPPAQPLVVYRVHITRRTGRFEREYGTSLGYQGQLGHLPDQV